MTLTVTPGDADADAFVSVEDCTAYCTAHGLTDWTSAARSPPEDDEAAIRRATLWLSTSFNWKGYRTNGRDQALALPRTDLTDGEGEDVASDEIPVEVVHACCIAAAYERANPGGLSPTVVMTDRVRREKIGPLETEYAMAPGNAEAARPIVLAINGLIGGLLNTTGSALAGTAVRS